MRVANNTPLGFVPMLSAGGEDTPWACDTFDAKQEEGFAPTVVAAFGTHESSWARKEGLIKRDGGKSTFRPLGMHNERGKHTSSAPRRCTLQHHKDLCDNFQVFRKGQSLQIDAAPSFHKPLTDTLVAVVAVLLHRRNDSSSLASSLCRETGRDR